MSLGTGLQSLGQSLQPANLARSVAAFQSINDMRVRQETQQMNMERLQNDQEIMTYAQDRKMNIEDPRIQGQLLERMASRDSVSNLRGEIESAYSEMEMQMDKGDLTILDAAMKSGDYDMAAKRLSMLSAPLTQRGRNAMERDQLSTENARRAAEVSKFNMSKLEKAQYTAPLENQISKLLTGSSSQRAEGLLQYDKLIADPNFAPSRAFLQSVAASRPKGIPGTPELDAQYQAALLADNVDTKNLRRLVDLKIQYATATGNAQMLEDARVWKDDLLEREQADKELNRGISSVTTMVHDAIQESGGKISIDNIDQAALALGKQDQITDALRAIGIDGATAHSTLIDIIKEQDRQRGKQAQIKLGTTPKFGAEGSSMLSNAKQDRLTPVEAEFFKGITGFPELTALREQPDGSFRRAYVDKTGQEMRYIDRDAKGNLGLYAKTIDESGNPSEKAHPVPILSEGMSGDGILDDVISSAIADGSNLSAPARSMSDSVQKMLSDVLIIPPSERKGKTRIQGAPVAGPRAKKLGLSDTDVQSLLPAQAAFKLQLAKAHRASRGGPRQTPLGTPADILSENRRLMVSATKLALEIQALIEDKL